MGRDKALLEVGGQPLWRLQLTKLEAVCDEVFLCGSQSHAAVFESKGVRFAADATAGLGPLSGIARALEMAQTSHVLILAVDMPKMSSRYMRSLLDGVESGYGVVPERAGLFEGLCAVYPVELLPFIRNLLAGDDRSLRSLIRFGLQTQRIRSIPVAASEFELFENWNTPNDLPQRGPQSPADGRRPPL
jgi:molybdopterin-guanine dinucleotide biosynthesis protein A